MTQIAMESPSNKLSLNRTNLLLVALFVVQAAVVAYLYWPGNTVPTENEPLLGTLDASDVRSISITGTDDATIQLDRTSDGWVATSVGNYPATATKVDEIVGKLLAINSSRLVTNTPGSHKRLKVADDDFNSKIEVTTADGTQTLYIGTAPSTGATHVRLSGQDATYLTGEVASWELSPQASTWIDTLYFEVPREEVVGLTVENTNGTVEFSRENGESPWTLIGLAEGETLDESTVTTLLSRVVSVRLVEPLGTTEAADYGLAAPQATVTIKTKDADGNEATHTLLVGSKNEESGNYLFKSSGSAYYVTVSSFTGDDLVGKARADFLTAAEEESSAAPTEEGAATDVEATDAGVTDVVTDTSTTDDPESSVIGDDAAATPAPTEEAPDTSGDDAESSDAGQ